MNETMVSFPTFALISLAMVTCALLVRVFERLAAPRRRLRVYDDR